MFYWNEQSIRWYKEAAEYGCFHEQIVKAAAPYINCDSTACDLGCGLGYLSLELAKITKQVTAIDIDDNALNVLRASICQNGTSNIEVMREDVQLIPSQAIWDVVVLCSFGRLTENNNFTKYMALCKKRLISIVGSNAKSNISPSGLSHYEKDHVPKLISFLEKQGIPYRLIEQNLEFGQPLSTQQDAIDFICHYTPGCTVETAAEHAKEHLKQLGDGRYYLPNQKCYGIFIIDKQEETT